MPQPLIPRYPEQARAIRRALAKLRDYAGTHEHSIRGYQAIADYLNDTVGLRRAGGKPLTKLTARTYVVKRGLPVIWLSKQQKVMTTNLMLLAWCWSYAVYRKERGRRPHRTLQERIACRRSPSSTPTESPAADAPSSWERPTE